MAFKPYLTSNDIIEAVKRKIMLPIDQSTFTPDDILTFVNEEMSIAQVPSMMEYHEEYFVFSDRIPLQSNQSRYPIPNRAIGMKLRDVSWADDNGNLFEMTRINADDKSYFQRTIGTNELVHKFYIEGNDIVLSPSLTFGPTGFLQIYYYLRPNQLVVNERAATIECFEDKILVDNDFVTALDTLTIDGTVFTAVNTLGGSITAITPNSSNTIITSASHQLSSGQTIVVTGSNSSPSINGTHVVTVIDSNTFTIAKKTASAGTTGSFTCKNQFQIAASSILTASNLTAAINNVGIAEANNGTPSTSIVTICYNNIDTEVSTSDEFAFILDDSTIGIRFNSLPNTFTNPLSNVTETLFEVGQTVDFLQTNPGHRTYKFDIEIPNISGTTIYFDKSDLLYYTNSESTQEQLIDLRIGDYICLSGECIIPQIPPELHTQLTERASARILAAIGDREGLAVVNQKIADMERREGNLIDDRVTGAPQKITARHSILKYNKYGNRGRII